MSVPAMTPHRLAQSTRDYTAIDAYARDAIDAYEYLRARAVPERPVVTLAAKLVVWAVWVALSLYCAALWMGLAS